MLSNIYAQKGRQAIGFGLSYGTEIESIGLGLKYQYNITNPIRLEPSLNYFIENKKTYTLGDLENEKLNLKESELKKDNLNEIHLSLNAEKENKLFELGLINFQATYSDFSYNIYKELEENKDFLHSIAYNKNLNSLLYGENDYKINNIYLQRKISNLNTQKIENEKTIDLIVIYGELLKIQKKIDLQNSYIKANEEQKIAFNFIPDSFDWEAFQFEEDSIKQNLILLYNEQDFYFNKLFSLSGVYFTKEDTLEDFKNTSSLSLDNIGKKDIIILENENNLLLEKEKYIFMKNRVQYDFSAEYTLELRDYLISLSASNSIMFTNFERKELGLDEKILETKVRDEKVNIKEKKEKILLTYNSLVTEINLLKTKNSLNKKNLLLKEKFFKSKSISYFDYLDEVNKLRDCDAKLIEKEIDLDVLTKSSLYYN